ncbi:hypothetical protein OS189_15015 [Sulfitobacter sp. F26169L]|uniref:hypothetical protein n=1 Tax=Sulfitobacter sp. F26169L TaxID=2996015 RepID=UPI0022608995|nr:hypothetical protein [Sulfitobacter sp. F26169L]MCX7567655.1 hypothetical protein [Sulfitobacter sp. F26169L]
MAAFYGDFGNKEKRTRTEKFGLPIKREAVALIVEEDLPTFEVADRLRMISEFLYIY